uniref:Uncharacterized protein n=1 Tax=Arundo donax TaxID=35708 RepID=A0A0A9BHA9_ARUDO
MYLTALVSHFSFTIFALSILFVQSKN